MQGAVHPDGNLAGEEVYVGLGEYNVCSNSYSSKNEPSKVYVFCACRKNMALDEN